MDSIEKNKFKNRKIMVLVAGAIVQLFLGIIYIWSVFQKPVMEFYHWDVGSAAEVASIMLGFFVAGILIGGKIQDKIGASKVVLGGGLLLAIGMFFTSIIPVDQPALIYLTYAVVGGFGVGCAYNATISTAQKWYPEKRGFATGVTVCAFGFSTVVFAPLVNGLIGKFGLQSTFRVLALTFLVVIFSMFSFLKSPNQILDDASASREQEQSLPKTKIQDVGQISSKKMLKTKEFYFITLSLMLATPAFFMLNPMFKLLGTQRGLTEQLALLGVMVTGIASASGRLLAPVLSDKMGRENTVLTLISITAISGVLLSLFSGYVFLISIALIAFAYGGYSGVYPVITVDYFGVKYIGSNYGFVMIGFGLSAIIFPRISNKLISQDNSTVLPFIISIVLCGIGFALMLFLKKKGKKAIDG